MIDNERMTNRICFLPLFGLFFKTIRTIDLAFSRFNNNFIGWTFLSFSLVVLVSSAFTPSFSHCSCNLVSTSFCCCRAIRSSTMNITQRRTITSTTNEIMYITVKLRVWPVRNVGSLTTMKPARAEPIGRAVKIKSEINFFDLCSCLGRFRFLF